MSPQCGVRLRPLLSAALENARAEAAGLLSVAFPPLPASAFDAIVHAQNIETLFLFENQKRNFAEAALTLSETPDFFENPQLENLAEFFPKNRRSLDLSGAESCGVPAPKIFFAGTFDSKSENLATLPTWQISKIGNRTNVCAHVFPERKDVSADALLHGFAALKNAAEMRNATQNPPQISAGTELGGNWYFAAAEKAVAEIRGGKFRKIVLARARDFALSGDAKKTAGTLFRALRERFIASECTLFLARTSAKNSAEKIVGATPEMLVRRTQGKLETEAIAGTAKNTGDARAAESALRDEKELREHRFVVDFIAEKLRERGLAPHFSDVPETLRLPNVFHLRTKIEADVPAKISLGEIAAALHPTPAMCGLPQNAAAKFIEENEPFPRENFSAPIGFADADGNGFFAVAIRCAKISTRGIRVYAGSGIVAESVPAKEFSEIESKFSAVLSVFEKAESE